MIFEISCSADLACDQKNSGASMGGPAFFSTLVGQAWEKELCQKSCLHIFRQASKNFLEKAFHEKSKILIKGGVSKFRYFQHACQSGPKINHSRSIHLSALPKHLGDWCLIGVVSFITNIFHRGGIIHKTESKKGHKNRSDSDCDA